MRLWMARVNTPSGERSIVVGPSGTEAEAIIEMNRFISGNPEWSYVPCSIEMIDAMQMQAKVEDRRREYADRWPHRPTVDEMTNGEPNRLLTQGWLDPESVQIPNPFADFNLARRMGLVKSGALR